MIKTWNKAAAVNLAKPLNLQLIIILLSCLCVAAAQGGGFLQASHYVQVLILACVFSGLSGTFLLYESDQTPDS